MYSNNNWWLDSHVFSENKVARFTSDETWNKFFMSVARKASDLSKCGSRHIGAVLVRDRQILAFGYNGAPAGSNLCQTGESCPRRKLNIPSGQGLELCPAQHAEENTVHNAAKNGISTKGATLYCACPLPCQRCAGALINAGITRVVCLDEPNYDSMAELLFESAGVEVVKLDPEIY